MILVPMALIMLTLTIAAVASEAKIEVNIGDSFIAFSIYEELK